MINPSKTTPLKEWFWAITIALIVLFVVHHFWISIYHVQSTSMNDTLFEGDALLVCKWNKTDVRQNDIILFKPPTPFTSHSIKKEALIKRCVGLPGHTVYIRQHLTPYDTGKFSGNLIQEYSVWFKPTKIKSWEDLNAYALKNGGLANPQNNQWLISASTQTIHALKKAQTFDSIKIASNHTQCFPYDASISWSYNSFGPFYIPQKGDTIILNSQNKILYASIIPPKHLNAPYYICNQNYYFVMGDNRPGSEDSRHFGLITQHQIIGKAWSIISRKEPKFHVLFRKL